MIVEVGVKDLVSDVFGDISNGQAGTSSALFDKTDTGLTTAVGATDVALVDKTLGGTSFSANHFLNTSTGNGSTYTEFELNNGSVSYNRSVKAGLVKTSSDEMNVIHTFTFEVVL